MAKRKDDKPDKKKRKPSITAKRVEAGDAKPFTMPQLTRVPAAEVLDDGDPLDDLCLTPKQKLFAIAYVGPAAFNATEAGRMAGYSSDNRPQLSARMCILLQIPHVAQYVARLIARKLGSAEWAEDRICTIAAADISNVLTIDPETGAARIDLAKAQRFAAVGQIREYQEERVEAGNGIVTVKAKVKMHDPTRALQVLLKLRGRLAERHDHTVNVAGQVNHTHDVTDDAKRILDDPVALDHANALARRLAFNARGPGESAN